MTALPQLKPVSIRHNVSEAIRRALLAGRFSPGQALSEVALAGEMQVSRGPVREALLVLAQEGLVSHSQNYGFSVVNLTEADRKEVRQIRLPLETLALELAKPAMDQAALQQLTVLKDQMVQAYVAGQLIECTQFDVDFHGLIWKKTGNSRLLASLRNLLAPYFAYGSAFKVSRPDLTPELLETQHKYYVDFLSGETNQTAAECVRFH
ncbi:MAG: GntR family transcriptional regulator [Bryobacteraceae bacterium]